VGVNVTTDEGTFTLLSHPVQPYIYRIDFLSLTLLFESLSLGVRGNIGYVGGGWNVPMIAKSIYDETLIAPSQIITEYTQQPFYMVGEADLEFQWAASTGGGGSAAGAFCAYSQASLTGF
jgi:hypothetical protein